MRLRSLQDSPDAFGSTFEESSRHTDETWAARLSELDNRYDLPLVALVDDEFAGLAWGRIEQGGETTAHLYQMWAVPEYRGHGIGKALLDAVIDWAKACGVEELLLGVTVGNDVARGLYDSAGVHAGG